LRVLQKAKKTLRAKIRSNYLTVHVRNQKSCQFNDLAGFRRKQNHVGLRKHVEYSAELNRGQPAGRHFAYTQYKFNARITSALRLNTVFVTNCKRQTEKFDRFSFDSILWITDQTSNTITQRCWKGITV